MAINYPGPYEIRIAYVTAEPAPANRHILRLSCEMSIAGDPGEEFSGWIPEQKDGSAVDTLESHLDALLAILKPMFPATTSFNSAELWEYAPGTFDSIFRSSHSIAEVGSSGTASVDFGQLIITFRSENGGIAKIDVRGSDTPVGNRVGFPTGDTSINALAAHLIAPSSIYVARDGGYLLSALFALPGLNEAAFKAVRR
jgi:hypothetical protein